MIFELNSLSDLAFLVLRLVIAAIFLYHSVPKLRAPGQMAQMIGMPAGMVFVLGGVEFLSSIGMILGVWVQIAALLLSIVMIGATWLKITKWHVPFGAMDKMGWEFDLILLASTLFLLVNGGGAIGLQ